MKPSNIIDHDFGFAGQWREDAEYICDLSGEFDGHAIFHSEEGGFLLRMMDGDSEEIEEPISIDQAMRLFMHGWVDDGGLFDALRGALDRAGVEPLKKR
jgi:hypothetical protein